MSFVAVDVVVRGEVVPMRFPAIVVVRVREAAKRGGPPVLEALEVVAEAMMEEAERSAPWLR